MLIASVTNITDAKIMWMVVVQTSNSPSEYYLSGKRLYGYGMRIGVKIFQKLKLLIDMPAKVENAGVMYFELRLSWLAL
jgi:hypothetical protein